MRNAWLSAGAMSVSPYRWQNEKWFANHCFRPCVRWYNRALISPTRVYLFVYCCAAHRSRCEQNPWWSGAIVNDSCVRCAWLVIVFHIRSTWFWWRWWVVASWLVDAITYNLFGTLMLLSIGISDSQFHKARAIWMKRRRNALATPGWWFGADEANREEMHRHMFCTEHYPLSRGNWNS